MTTQIAFDYLTTRYKGQLVLYSAELAEVLGKSEKALEHLIARGSLPFTVKKVGGRSCVDVFQVASWLANGGDSDSIKEKGSNTAEVTPTSPKRGVAGRRSLAGKLLEMRFDAAIAMKRAAFACSDELEQEFVIEFASFLIQTSSGRDSGGFRYFVHVKEEGKSLVKFGYDSLDDAKGGAVLHSYANPMIESVAIYDGNQCVQLEYPAGDGRTAVHYIKQ